MKNQKSGITIPTWLMVVAAILLVFITLYFAGYFNKPDVKKAEAEKTVIQTKIDSKESKINDDRTTLVQNSQQRADESIKIKNKNTDEKITIPDTTYSAMAKFITDFRPE